LVPGLKVDQEASADVAEVSSDEGEAAAGEPEAVAEQDRAAGGADRRAVRLPGGRTATGSVELKFLGGRRIYAYLRYIRDGRTVATYVGEAPGATREERLRVAWAKVHADGLTDPS
jgi:DNA mismatch endonuclease (patch repair protein)